MPNNFPPNIDPTIFNLTAVVIGAITTDNFSDYELFSIGNWLLLLGQYLVTYAAQLQLIQTRMQNNTYQSEYQKQIDALLNAINIIKKELENIKREKN